MIDEVRTAQGGDKQARELLLAQFRPMIVKAARRLLSRAHGFLELDDLVSVGLLALNRAITQFDETRGTRFPYYAGQQIRYAMLHEIRRCRGGPDCESIEDLIDTEQAGEEASEMGFEDRQISRLFWNGAFKACLNMKERFVIKGIIYDRMTQVEVGDDLGLSQQRVNDLYQAALTKLKEYCIENGLDANTTIVG